MKETGTLHIKAVCKQNKTVVADTYFEGAFKVARPVYFTENEPTLYSLHIGGGYVGGDRYHTSVKLEEKAELILTTQSAAKVYKTPNEPVYQSMDISLQKGSVFTYLPDPLIAYEHARFVQETTIHMEKGSTLLFTDMITPGWAKSGEPFRYEWIRSKLKIIENGRIQTYDHLFLKPDESDLFSIMQMEGYTHVGSIFIISPELPSRWMEEIEKLMETFEGTVRAGWSSLKGNGFSVRILANETYVLEEIILKCANWLRFYLGQPPVQLRKY